MSTALTFTHNTQYPAELLYAVCAQVYASCLLPDDPSLDPLIYVEGDKGIPIAHPSSVPPGYWPEPVARRTLANLCLVNHAWYGAAKPWLWHQLEVRLPRTWLSLVEEIAWNYDEETVDSVMGKTIQAATQAALDSAQVVGQHDQTFRIDENIFSTLDAPDLSIGLDLLSPVPSRDPSPRRLRPKSKSPARWKILRSISDAIQDVMNMRAPGVYVPTPQDPRPGRFVRHLDFNHFRTIGMRRSVEEGVNSRFVTGDRVEAVLKEMPNLTAFGATEYMDGALTLRVLNELFLRGAPSGGRGRPTRGRALMELNYIEEEDRERRRECKDIEAVDLTGCVSAVFVNAFTDFVNMHLLPPPEAESSGDEDDSGRRSRQRNNALYEPLLFPGLRRLGMLGVKSILPRFLGPFLLAFPHLTHLDLSGTRLTPEILDSLSQSPTLRLKSLALARCIKLTSESITHFLVDSPVTWDLTELNLYGDMTYPSPITVEDLTRIIDEAPSFTRGNLVYLDLSSVQLTRGLLSRFKPQLKLRSLGLSHILHLELKTVTEFVKNKTPNVEILTLVNTSPELDCGIRLPTTDARNATRQSSIALHTQLIRPLCSPPFSFSVLQPMPAAALPPPTRLRVIELATAMLGGLGAGGGSWRIIRSKGGRGWYVDTASAWIAEPGSGEGSVLCRNLPPSHLYRVEMDKLSAANGNVSSGVGWHPRKMEILHGHGMLGREDGLYGAVSFAYQG